ncbi:hypothetical protein VOF77_00015 [Leclercia adecarboxylata]|uniref:Uncharacterized protein n=1 Tax=Leclercia adecarboxylata TaxID=83655 RepID=A0ABU6I305_9ENTR|nr:hypothetical protein [Leclercia adecarboxylata]MCE9982456.1 hypothetical protein [Leclercia adecarboxylata]MDH0062574.1 hypothetical protein [Leclercia adecarboxylata]MEC3900692.1 hypothetical protein [Leclercia adecarboxylata]MEC3935960.1 hypothetical protein [Leclercia adecarboxylata]
MALEVFRSDRQLDSEEAYQKWLTDNPEGFVVNALKTACGKGTESDKRFTRIHRASCKTINPLLSEADKAGFTTGDYQKLCANNLEIAVKEARMVTGIDDVTKCRCV